MHYAMESFTGVRPTADLTVANYIGAVKPILDAEEAEPDAQSAVFLAEIHAATTANPRDVAVHSRELTRTLIASGYNGEIYSQWDIEDLVGPTELSIRGLVSVARLLRLPTLKDKVGGDDKIDTAPVDLAMYPMMMAADIILARPEFVPTGKDQLPHLEITREIVRAHNAKYGTELPMPEAKNVDPINIGTLSRHEGKMSKTEPKGAIFLGNSPDEARTKIMKAVTASGPGAEMDARIDNLLTIARGLASASDTRLDELTELADAVKAGEPQTPTFKDGVAEITGDFIADLQERRDSVSDSEVDERRSRGHEWIRPIASATLDTIKTSQRT